jgi:signal transduction histidine kinase
MAAEDTTTPVENRPLDDALAELERGRRDRWIVGIVLALAAIAVLSLQTLEAAEDLESWVILALVGLVVIHALTVALQERRARRAIVSLIAEQQASASLRARAQTLEHVQRAVRDVIAASTLPEVFERLLDGAMRFSDASSGTVLLRVGDTLTVAASSGDGALPRGHRVARGEGVAWSAVHAGEPVLVGHRPVPLADQRADPAASVIAAPLRLPGRTVGVLVVERAASASPFGEPELAAIRLFAEQAALAVRNASRLDAERATVAELEAQTQTRAEVAAGILHDLKGPLSAVSGFVQLAAEQPDALPDGRRDQLLTEALGEVDRLRSLADGLVRVTAAEAGALSTDTPVDLAALVADVAQPARAAASSLGQRRTISVDAAAPIVVRGDQTSLWRALMNLVTNAIEHTPADTPIELSLAADHDSVRLTVRDHGPGMSEEARATAFEVFARGASGGTGLGLHVARTLVEAHGGECVLLAALGGGTAAEIRLPASIVEWAPTDLAR